MPRRSFNKELLLETLTRDGATLIGEYPSLNSVSIIKYKCKCGAEGEKAFNIIIDYAGAFCSPCVIKNKTEKTCASNIKKYGVPYISQSKEIKEKVKKTCLETYGVEYSLAATIVREKGKITIKEKYGVENPSQSEEIKQKKIETTFKHYGVENPFQSNIIKDTIKETNLIKYGVESPLQNKEIMEKVKETCLKIYGVTHNSKSDEIKEKKKTTSLVHYGVDNPNKSKEVRDKLNASNLVKHGVEHTLQLSEVREKGKETMLDLYGVDHPTKSTELMEKTKQTNMTRLGVEYPGQSEEVKEKSKATNLIRYGVEYPSQNSEIMEKAQKNAKKFKEFKFPSGIIRKVQGYEPIALKELITAGYTEEQIKTERTDVPRITYSAPDGKSHYYFPDIYIPHENRIIEVKSTWTYGCKEDNIELKKKATIEKGYKYEIWCYDNKEVKIDLSTYIFKKSTLPRNFPIEVIEDVGGVECLTLV